MNIYVVVLFLFLLSNTQQQDVMVGRYPPPWTKSELDASDRENLLGYCAEEEHRCGHTDIKGGMGGTWVHCCPGLWCSPSPSKSKDLYSISCPAGTSSSQSDTCWYYEYPYEKLICKKDNYYPPLPIDYARDTHNDKKEWAPKFPDEN